MDKNNYETENHSNDDLEQRFHDQGKSNMDEIAPDQTITDEQEETVVTSNPNETDLDIKKAGFWVRFWAYLIDVVIVFSLNGIILSPVAFFDDIAIFQWEYISVVGIMSGIVYYLYFLLMTKSFQQTIGKMVMGIKVISSKSDRIAWSDIVFREVIGRFLHNVFFFLK